MRLTSQEIAVFFVFRIKIIFSKKKEPVIQPVLPKANNKALPPKIPLILLMHYQGYFHALYRNMSMSKNYRLRIFLRNGRMLAGLTESSSMPMRTNSLVKIFHLLICLSFAIFVLLLYFFGERPTSKNPKTPAVKKRLIQPYHNGLFVPLNRK